MENDPGDFEKNTTPTDRTIIYRIIIVPLVLLFGFVFWSSYSGKSGDQLVQERNLFSCNGKHKAPNKNNYTLTPVKNSRNIYLITSEFTGVIFFPDSLDRIEHQDSVFTPKVEDIFKAEKIFQAYLKTGMKDKNGVELMAKDLKPVQNYYRQYRGYINGKGQKLISFDCLTKSQAKYIKDWEWKKILVRDGGNSFFDLRLNIDTKECEYFYVHESE